MNLDNFENEKAYFDELNTNSLDLTTRTFNFLSKNGLSIDEIRSMSTDELRNIRGIGPKTILEIPTKLKKILKQINQDTQHIMLGVTFFKTVQTKGASKLTPYISFIIQLLFHILDRI